MTKRVLLTGVFVVAGCADNNPTALTPTALTSTTLTPTSEPIVTNPEPDDSTPASTTAPTTALTTASTAAPCDRLTDFSTEAQTASWIVVNDDVMGGRSDGEVRFDESVMVFSGSINTDGGGFASLRLPIAEGVLSGVDRVELRVKTDGREYKLTLRDALEGRDQRTSHQAVIPMESTSDWQIVSVSLADLTANVFGRSVETEPFERDLANRIGLMMSDGIDGSFTLEVDWIDLCRD